MSVIALSCGYRSLNVFAQPDAEVEAQLDQVGHMVESRVVVGRLLWLRLIERLRGGGILLVGRGDPRSHRFLVDGQDACLGRCEHGRREAFGGPEGH